MNLNTLKYSIILLFTACLSTTANSQVKPTGLFNISWQTSLPLSGANEFIDKFSWGGINLEGIGFLNDNLAVGGEFSTSYTYKEYDNATYVFENDNFEAAVTGVQSRSNRNVPILVKGYYFFNSNSIIQPYIGGGIGLAYSQNMLSAGMHLMQEDLWGFSAGADLGADLMVPNSAFGVHIGAKYNYTNVPNSALNQENNISRLNFNLGLTFILE